MSLLWRAWGTAWMLIASAFFQSAYAQQPIDVFAGREHSMAIRSDGSLWVWGRNEYLGLDWSPQSSRTAPSVHSGLGTVIHAAAGPTWSAVVKSDGTVWMWGKNDYGQLGFGNYSAQGAPKQNTLISGAKYVYCSGSDAYDRANTYVVKTDGTVLASGSNVFGQLGNGTTTGSYPYGRSVPDEVPGLSDVISLAVGSGHVVAIKSDGTVWAWGLNSHGQLGDGTTINRAVPVQVPSLSNMVSAACGSEHSLALAADGSVWAWGANSSGQLGDGTQTERLSPIRITGLNSVARLVSRGERTLAVLIDRTAWAWGDNYGGELGDGTVITRLVPTRVPNITGAIRASLGDFHALVATDDGSVWSWGKQTNGVLGDGSGAFAQADALETIEGVSAVSMSVSHVLALKNDGTVWAWGANHRGQLGRGNAVPKATPIPQQVPNLLGVVAISAGGSFSLALKSDGTVWSWGGNYAGQLGDGSLIDKPTPIQVTGLTGITSVSAGASHSLARKSDGTVWTWGDNGNGQLGDGTQISASTPKKITTLSGITHISAGNEFSLALKSDGTVSSWGLNDRSQLGNGTQTSRFSPGPVSGLTAVVAIAAGNGCAAALKSTGETWHWGNVSGYLSTGSLGQVPSLVQNLNRVSCISASDRLAAVSSNGSVFGWGAQLVWSFPMPDYELKYQVAARGISGVSVGGNATVAVRTDGKLIAWGESYSYTISGLPALRRSAIRLTPSATDTDQDGQEDLWEFQNFGSLAASSGGTDSDSDGISDIREFLAHSDPRAAFYESYRPQAGLRLWLNAATLSGLQEGTSVTDWLDSSDHGLVATQATATRRPTFSLLKFNGQPSVTFSAPAQQTLAINGSSFLNIKQPTIAAIIRRDSGSGTAFVIEKGSNTTGYSLRMASSTTGASTMNGNLTSTGAVTAAGRPMSLVCTYDEVSHKIYLDGILRDTNAYTSSILGNSDPLVIDSLTIGGRGNGDYALTGDIAEILIYDHALSEAERADLSTYFTMKYPVDAMSRLPAPVANLGSGTYAGPQTVSLSLAIGLHTKIYYTLDGSRPTPTSALYQQPISITSNTILRAYAVKEGYFSSDEASWEITIDPATAPVVRDGLVLWLTGKSFSGVSTGTPVSQWPDQSGLGNHAVQDVALDKPTVKSAGQNSQPTVSFSAAGTQYLTVPNSAELNPTQITMIAVAKRASGTGSMAILEKEVPDANGVFAQAYRLYYTGGAAPTTSIYAMVNGKATSAANALPLSEFSVISARYNQAELTLGANGVDLISTPYTSAIQPNSRNITIGGRTTSYCLDGEIAEVLIYSRSLSGDELAKVFEYLYLRYKVGTRPTLPPPKFSLPSGIYTMPLELGASSSRSDATIQYTIDGTNPTSTSLVYSQANGIEIEDSVTVKAIARHPDFNDSAICSIKIVSAAKANAYQDGLSPEYNLDSNTNGIPDSVESALGLVPNAPSPPEAVPGTSTTYDYDKLSRLRSGPGGGYDYDQEGNLTGR